MHKSNRQSNLMILLLFISKLFFSSWDLYSFMNTYFKIICRDTFMDLLQLLFIYIDNVYVCFVAFWPLLGKKKIKIKFQKLALKYLAMKFVWYIGKMIISTWFTKYTRRKNVLLQNFFLWNHFLAFTIFPREIAKN